jgi:hypothetical protein
MNPRLTTTPGGFDVHLRGERFASYKREGPAPGFTALYAGGLRPVTQPHPAVDRAVWVAHGNVNGVAFGPEPPPDRPAGRIVTVDSVARRGNQSVGFRHETAWQPPDGEPLLREVRTVRIAPGPAGGALVDVTLALSSLTDTAVTLGQTEDTLLCVRIAAPLTPSGGGQLRNSNDDFGPGEIHGRQAAWCACNGVVQGETVGLAFLEHPNNPWYPSPWICREDGTLSPSVFGWRTEELAPAATLRLRYRLVIHSGYVEAGWVRARLVDWLRES